MRVSKTAANYDPLDDNTYMSQQMMEYFKNQLTQLHEEVLKKEKEISLSVVDTSSRETDMVDKGTLEEIHQQDFSLFNHEEELREKIELSLSSINNGTYGYCKKTGDPIGIERLLAVPYAIYSLEEQTRRE